MASLVSIRHVYKILKEKGLICRGASTSKALVEGCDWNRELSIELEDHLKSWKVRQNHMNDAFKSASVTFFNFFFNKVLIELKHSDCGISSIAIARVKWLP